MPTINLKRWHFLYLSHNIKYEYLNKKYQAYFKTKPYSFCHKIILIELLRNYIT